ncbi:hypothetical protein, partial [Cupriavidus sp. 8B]
APQAEVVGTKFCFASEHLTRSKVLHFRFEAAQRRRFSWLWNTSKALAAEPGTVRIRHRLAMVIALRQMY